MNEKMVWLNKEDFSESSCQILCDEFDGDSNDDSISILTLTEE